MSPNGPTREEVLYPRDYLHQVVGEIRVGVAVTPFGGSTRIGRPRTWGSARIHLRWRYELHPRLYAVAPPGLRGQVPSSMQAHGSDRLPSDVPRDPERASLNETGRVRAQIRTACPLCAGASQGLYCDVRLRASHRTMGAEALRWNHCADVHRIRS